MYEITVPHAAPLTHQNDAQAVYVVSDGEGLAGVYPTLQRACEYILDWLAAGPVNYEPGATPRELYSGVWYFNGYHIEKTYYRV